MGMSLMNMLSLVKCTYRIYLKHVIENSSLCTICKSSVSAGFAKQIMLILRVLCYNGTLVTWKVVTLTTAKFKPFIFAMSGFDLCYTANMFVLMILYDFCLLSAQFCYIIIYILKVENRLQIADQCALWKISNGAENLVFSASKFWELGACR
jgi:hypothetical protein